MYIRKSVRIQRPRKEVYEYLKWVRNQEAFSVWNMRDPQKKVEYSGEDGTVGFVYTWDSPTDKNVGAGSQEIKDLVEGEKIAYELRFERPMKNVAQSQFLLSSASDAETEVTWDFRGPTQFPMSLFAPIFKRMLGKDLAKSLENLKEVLEK